MKNFKKLVSGVAMLFMPAMFQAQNFIQNPGFEAGTIPAYDDGVLQATGWVRGCAGGYCSNCTNTFLQGSPDLFDSRSPGCTVGVPANKWGTRGERTGGYRYVGFTGHSSPMGPQYFGESVLGTLTAPLQAGCDYVISYWASAIDGFGMNCFSSTNPQVPYGNQIEVILRKTNDCNTAKVIHLSSPITQTSWNYFSGVFTMSPADVALGYTKIEFRINNNWPSGAGGSHAVYLDDVSISYNTSSISSININGEPNFQCGQGGIAPTYYNCGSLALNATYSNGTPAYYKIELFAIDGDCEQLTDPGYLNFATGWNAGAVPANLNIRTLTDGSGMSIATSGHHAYYLKVYVKDGCGNISVQTNRMYIYDAVSASLSLQIYNSYFTNPANTYLPAQHNMASAIPTGALSAGFRINGSTGVVTGYKIEVLELDVNGYINKVIYDKTFTTNNITSVSPINLNSLCVDAPNWSPYTGGNACTSTNPSYSGWTGYFGFTNGQLSLNNNYLIIATLFNPCSNFVDYSYVKVTSGYLRPSMEVGLDEEGAGSTAISVFPNPASSQVKFKIAAETDDVYDIAIYDLAGKQVRSVASGQKLAQGEQVIEVNTAGLEKGLYIYKVKSSQINKSGLLQIAE